MSPRVLPWLLISLVSGCSCSFELFPEESFECFQDSDCDNGVFCDGPETCEDGWFGGSFCSSALTGVGCDFGEACDEAAGVCVDCALTPTHALCPPTPRLDAGMDAFGDAGSCAELGCALQEQCASFRDAPPMCYRLCPVGEDDENYLGHRGHGARCEIGDACYWAGIGSEPVRGFCAEGNYNNIGRPNLGAACTDHAQCYSPYGRGRCAHLGERPVGICVIDDCAGPRALHPSVRVPHEICPEPEASCGDDSVCRARCETADGCPAGYACAAEREVCAATCVLSTECRADEACVDAAGDQCGDEGACTCEPLAP